MRVKFSLCCARARTMGGAKYEQLQKEERARRLKGRLRLAFTEYSQDIHRANRLANRFLQEADQNEIGHYVSTYSETILNAKLFDSLKGLIRYVFFFLFFSCFFFSPFFFLFPFSFFLFFRFPFFPFFPFFLFLF